ncbi:MAG TPA: Fur family transcriptional regulator [Candidatus Saccharimonadales bacterium]|nr:Fur family transcriptional regulator [Candidatus Saccharimonadales bacterium]
MGSPQEVSFQQLCREKQLAMTHQRLVLYRTLMQMTDHPSPEQIFDRIRVELPSISLATVYKNLHAFLEAGIVSEVSPHHGSLRIESNAERHHHFICMECHTITDLAPAQIDETPLISSVPPGFQVEQVSMEIRGLCGRCSESNLSPPQA